MEAPIGTRLRRVRRAKDVTQAQLAAQTGLNVITISRLENGAARAVYGDTIVALARALGVSSDYLLGLSEREERCD
jgi:transcriptional regulator with XRE-family HTH domain